MRFGGCAATLHPISQPTRTVIVPDHWAEARKRHTANGRQITMRRFGWSMVSDEDAAAMAERRADEAIGRIVAGANIPRREPKVPYNGAQGVPIREEVLQRLGDDVVTRNAYGAYRLNMPCALFAGARRCAAYALLLHAPARDHAEPRRPGRVTAPAPVRPGAPAVRASSRRVDRFDARHMRPTVPQGTDRPSIESHLV